VLVPNPRAFRVEVMRDIPVSGQLATELALFASHVVTK